MSQKTKLWDVFEVGVSPPIALTEVLAASERGALDSAATFYGVKRSRLYALPRQRIGHARMVESPTGREVYASKERDHHITTHGRQTLHADQFALPPGSAEKRRSIKGRLPIDTLKRARNALARAAQMKKRSHISTSELTTVKRKVHAAWPSIVES